MHFKQNKVVLILALKRKVPLRVTNHMLNSYLHMSVITSKPIFGVTDLARLKPARTATKASLRLEMLGIETSHIPKIH